MTDQKRLPTPVERTIQRLVNGESRFHKDYLRGFFDGKSAAAILEGIEALRDCWLDGRCNPDHAFELLQIVNDLAVESAAEGREFRFSYRDESFRLAMAMLTGALEQGHTNKLRVAGLIFREAPNLLSTRDRQDTVGRVIAKGVIRTNQWLTTVRGIHLNVLGWGAIEVASHPDGNPALVELFEAHCDVAGRDFLDNGSIGLAAALCTIGGGTDGQYLTELYERARAAGQAVSLACVQPIDELRTGPLRGTKELLTELFGSEAVYQPIIEQTTSRDFEADGYAMDECGVVLAQHPFYNALIRRYIAQGRWRDGARMIGRYGQLPLGVVALIGMTWAVQEGNPRTAAAYGQVALSAHLAVPADTRDTDADMYARSPITRVVNGILRDRFERTRAALQSRIHSARYPHGEYIQTGSDMFPQQEQAPSCMVPQALLDEWNALETMIADERRRLVTHFVKQINDLFDGVIVRGERLELHLFD